MFHTENLEGDGQLVPCPLFNDATDRRFALHTEQRWTAIHTILFTAVFIALYTVRVVR